MLLFSSSLPSFLHSSSYFHQTRRSVKYGLGRTVYDNYSAGSASDSSNGLTWRFQVPDGLRNFALAMLFDSYVERTVRSELRGDKELGYVAMSFVRREWNAIYWILLFQTDRRMSLAEAFIADFIAITVPKEMDFLVQNATAYAELCSGAISLLRQPLPSLNEEAETHFRQIDNMSFDFDFRLRAASLIESGVLSSSDVADFAKTFVLPKAPKRRLLACRMHAHKDSKPQSVKALQELEQPPLPPRDHDVQETLIDSLGHWKRSRPLNGFASESKL